MGQGLGRNSPVQLTLGKENYCALIERHGQWIRWRVASKCSCVKLPSMQPDIHCSICGGRGYLYSFQNDQIIFESVMQKTNDDVLEISDSNVDCELVKVYDFNGKSYTNAEKLNSFIYLNEKVNQKGVYYTVVLRKKNIKTLNNAVAIKNNLGFYTVPGLKNLKGNIEGIYYESPSDIISIGKIVDGAGLEYSPEEFRLDTFVIKNKTENVEIDGKIETKVIPITEPVTVENVEYLPPFIFALLNQNLNKFDNQMMLELQGDAVVTFPYECNVSNDDILTVLAGTYTNKEVLMRTEFETDTVGVYFVNDIVSCSGIINGKYVEYEQGKDFILVGTNKIKWLETNESNYPEIGESYSITYHVFPTYKVLKEIPQIRTSENQRFPKKAVVKLFTTYSENIGINKQNINQKGIQGSF